MAGPPKKKLVNAANEAKAPRAKAISDLQQRQQEECLELLTKHQKEQRVVFGDDRGAQIAFDFALHSHSFTSPFVPASTETSLTAEPSISTIKQYHEDTKFTIKKGFTDIEVIDLISDDEQSTKPAVAEGAGRTIQPNNVVPNLPFLNNGAVFNNPLTHSHRTLDTPTSSHGRKRKPILQPDSSPEIPLSQLRAQRQDQTPIIRSPTPIPRDANLRALEAAKKNGDFVKEILHNGRAQNFHPELSRALEHPRNDVDGDVRMNDTDTLTEPTQEDLIVRLNPSPNSMSELMRKGRRSQSIVDEALRPTNPIETWNGDFDAAKTPLSSSSLADNRKHIVARLNDAIAESIKVAIKSRNYRIPDGASPLSHSMRLALQIDQVLATHYGDPTENVQIYTKELRGITITIRSDHDILERLLDGRLKPDALVAMPSKDKQISRPAADSETFQRPTNTSHRLPKTHSREPVAAVVPKELTPKPATKPTFKIPPRPWNLPGPRASAAPSSLDAHVMQCMMSEGSVASQASAPVSNKRKLTSPPSQNSPLSRKRRLTVELSDSDSDDEPMDDSPCPSPGAVKRPVGIRSAVSKSNAGNPTTPTFGPGIQNPGLTASPRTPPSKRTKVSTPKAPRNAPVAFRSASEVLSATRSKRSAAVKAGMKTQNYYEMEKKTLADLDVDMDMVSGSGSDYNDGSDGDDDAGMKEVGGRMKSMNIVSPSNSLNSKGKGVGASPGGKGGKGGKGILKSNVQQKEKDKAYENWMKKRETGDRRVARSVSFALQDEEDEEM